ncbi:MAG: M50 family metallopeptidase [Microgenomates group bacterium]
MLTILVLSILVLLHEFGHFIIAKLFGIHVLEFGIGLPPKALKLFKHKETEYTLNWLPIGGFVRLAGEETDPTLWERINPLTHSHMFFAKPAWQRALVILAGVTMNFLIGIAAFSVIYTKMGIPKEIGSQVMVTQVVEGSPAKLAQMEVGQVVVRVGDEEIISADRFVELIKENKGKSVSLYLAKVDANGERSSSETQVSVIPRENPPEGQGALGVGVSSVPIFKYEKLVWYKAPIYGAIEGTKEAIGWSREFLRIFSHPVELFKNMSGPVAVVKVGQSAAKEGWLTMVRFAGIISLNLAIFNLLPIPALDGGRLLFVILEKVIGRKMVVKFEGYLNSIGMILLIGLMLFATVKDLFFS